MVRFCLVLICNFLIANIASAQDAGVLPVGADGKPLNLDFETGTLKDWTVEGKAFEGQPIKGDTVYLRRKDNKSQHQGQYWIGAYEKLQDKPQGTLTSVPFKVTHSWASFLVGGGPWMETCVELVLKDPEPAAPKGGLVIFRASGLEEENLRRVAVNLNMHMGKEMFIRIVDRHSGHWGHVNFDDFRFHAQKPKVPARPKAPVTDVLKYAGLPPEKAARAMTVPEGFDVKLFAGEPDVMQPIAMCLDDRGRVWVAEAYSYPIRRKDPKDFRDRILIFEDTDGDGKHDKRTLFMDGLNLVSGIEVGFGGVWIGAAPNFMFVPMKDDKPSGPPQILLDGWGYQDTHETLNSFIWGPDGWLYGCHGVFTHSKVGKPGTPDKDRVPINAGVWRYHPTRHVFEVFAHGTSNPWGLDFNDYGQAFVEACVIPHCFHIIQGGRYHRQGGVHFNPHTYSDIKTIADHFHYLGATPHGGNERSDSAGGGHAHCGTMIYLGGAWPQEYRGQMFMGNIHGRRLNVDILKPQGSGYVASHGKDFLLANDAWSRFINMRYGPDGNVYVIDWYDKQACHTGNVQVWDRTNGRIYKICHRSTTGEPRGVSPRVNLQEKTDLELVEYQLHENDWYVRHARRILQERKGGTDKSSVLSALLDIMEKNKDETKRLRALWAYNAVVDGAWEMPMRRKWHVDVALSDSNPMLRAWGVQFATQDTEPSKRTSRLDEIIRLAQGDAPLVRLYVASALQRLEYKDRWTIASHLLTHSEDALDHNLPLMYWYAIEPLADVDPARALALALNGKIPQLHGFMIRRIGAGGDATGLLIDALAKTQDAGRQRTFLTAMRETLKGRRQVPMPDAWPKVFDALNRSDDRAVRDQAACLAVTFGDPDQALDRLNKGADPNAQALALAALLDAGHKLDLQRFLEPNLKGTPVRQLALRGLANDKQSSTPTAILSAFATFTADEKLDALNTLAARPEFAKALLGAVAAKKIDAKDVSADIIRHMRNLKDKDLSERLNEVWGVVRDTPAERLKAITDAKKMLTTPAQVPPDLALGRKLYDKSCAQCHTLFGVGGKVGPDLTGSNRANLDYLLENILDPSAVIPKEYTASVIELRNGRVVTGIVRSDTKVALTVVTVNETLVLPRAEVEARIESKISMMPEDLLKQLSAPEIRALVAYLQSPQQVVVKTSSGR